MQIPKNLQNPRCKFDCPPEPFGSYLCDYIRIFDFRKCGGRNVRYFLGFALTFL